MSGFRGLLIACVTPSDVHTKRPTIIERSCEQCDSIHIRTSASMTMPGCQSLNEANYSVLASHLWRGRFPGINCSETQLVVPPARQVRSGLDRKSEAGVMRPKPTSLNESARRPVWPQLTSGDTTLIQSQIIVCGNGFITLRTMRDGLIASGNQPRCLSIFIGSSRNGFRAESTPMRVPLVILQNS